MNDDDMAFLREVQARGWTVEAAKAGECIVSCPSFGCGVRLKLRRGGSIPARPDGAWKPGTIYRRLKDKAGRWRHPVSGQSFTARKSSESWYDGIELLEPFRSRFEQYQADRARASLRDKPDGFI